MELIRMLNNPIAHGVFLTLFFLVGSLLLNRDQVSDPYLYVVAATFGVVGAAVQAFRQRRNNEPTRR